MRILITGAGGQLGRSLIRELHSHQLFAFDRAELDICDANRVRIAVKSTAPDLIINAAAYNDVDGAETQVDLAEAINCHGPRILAQESAAAGIPIVHISTDYVFDGRSERSYNEDDLPNPLSAYARSKRAGELAVIGTNPKHFIVRTAWLFESAGRNFLNAMRAMADRAEIRVVADQYGSPTYAPHLAHAIARLIEGNSFGLYHMAAQGGVSRYDLVRHLFELLGITTRIVPISQDEFPAAAVRPRNTTLGTIRDPDLRLPPWQKGVSAFAADVRSHAIEKTSSEESTATLDRTVVNKLRLQGGSELVAEVVEAFLSDLNRLVSQIRLAVAARDEARLKDGAHALRGCSSGIGANRVWKLCQELELAAGQNFSGAADLQARLDSAASSVRAELSAEAARK